MFSHLARYGRVSDRTRDEHMVAYGQNTVYQYIVVFIA